MKKFGIAVLSGAFVLVSASAGIAGPNVGNIGAENFNIQARKIMRDQVQARDAMYAKTGTPKMVSNWRWVRTNGAPSYRPSTVQALKRVPAK